MLIKDFLEGIGGTLKGNREGKVGGVSIDTRTLKEGDLFVAIIGERYDGHSFLPQAFAAGAAGVVVSKEIHRNLPEGTFSVKVDDTTKALGRMAVWYRRRFSIPVIAITGSAGKTTTKELVAAILGERFVCRKTLGNLNNEYGLPLTLLQLDSKDEILITEMGMRALGEIKALAQIALPQIGIITNVGPTHLETLGKVENVAKGKGELASSLPQDGHLILNGDDPLVRSMAPLGGAKAHFYGIKGEDLHIKGVEIKDLGLRGIQFQLATDNFTYHLPLPGEHNLYNALAALTLGQIFQITPKEMQAALKKFQASPLRSEIIEFSSGITLINDSYNANPLSMEMALKTLAKGEALRRVAILGDMLELGHISKAKHQYIGEIVSSLGIHLLFTTGDGGYQIAVGALKAGMDEGQVTHSPTKQELFLLVKGVLKEGDLILLKASRGMALEGLIQVLGGEGCSIMEGGKNLG